METVSKFQIPLSLQSFFISSIEKITDIFQFDGIFLLTV